MPASKEFQFDFRYTERQQTLTDWISEDAATALHTFSLAANKSTGAGHPSDRQRWFEFLSAVHENHTKLDTDLLGRWLVEVEDWPPEMAHDLVDKYQYSMDFLRFRTKLHINGSAPSDAVRTAPGHGHPGPLPRHLHLAGHAPRSNAKRCFAFTSTTLP